MEQDNLTQPENSAFDLPQEETQAAAFDIPGQTAFELPDDPPAPEQPANAASQDDGWFDEILGKSAETAPQIDVDESAVYLPGLTDPADMELERIIEETKAASPDAPSGESYFHTPEPLEPQTDAEDAAAVPESDYPTHQTPVHVDYYEVPVGDTQEELPEEAEPGEAPQQKRRPAWKKGEGLLGIPHILVTAVWLLVVLAVGVSLGRLIWVCAADVLAFGKPMKEAVITIREGDTLDEISEKLADAGLIEYPGLFTMYLEFSGNDEMEVGVHQLSPMIYDYHAIKTALEPRAAARDVVDVVIPEGYTCQQIFALLEEKGVCSAAQLEQYAAEGNLNEYWFLEGVERGDKYCLEGYLFPDTYQFYKGHDPELVLEKMLDNFDYRFTDIMRDKIEVLNERMAATLRSRGYDEATIKSRMFTVREVVIVASMIERETASGTESYDISSVIYNRLTNPGNYPFLNIDATVIYGMGGPKVDPVTGDNLPLTSADLANDTPYNTYTRKGLIPGPISNPGRNSINAALDPNDTGYYFYVFDPSTGEHRFAHNEAEHEQNKARVQNNG